MDRDEAKLILANYTLVEPPADNERFNAAMNLVKKDPDLKHWWENQQECDRAISASLQSFEVPKDLKSALQESLATDHKRPSPFRRWRNLMAMAALLTLSAVLYFQYGIDRSDEYQGTLVERAYAYSVDGPRLSYFNRDTQKLQDWLLENEFDLPAELPPKLLDLEGVGCRALNWSEEKVALMCFNADTVYHLFVAYQKDFDDPEFQDGGDLDFLPRGKNWSVSKWKDQDYLFVLTAKATQSEMTNYLASYSPISASELP